MRGKYIIIKLCLVAIVSVSDFYVPSFLVERGGGNEIFFHHAIVKIQVTGEAKASHTLDKLEIYGDHRFRPLHSSHVDLCLILLRC